LSEAGASEPSHLDTWRNFDGSGKIRLFAGAAFTGFERISADRPCCSGELFFLHWASFAPTGPHPSVLEQLFKERGSRSVLAEPRAEFLGEPLAKFAPPGAAIDWEQG
jgi:hypothetical protein